MSDVEAHSVFHLWLLGDTSTPDMQPVVACCSALAHELNVRRVAGVDAAENLVRQRARFADLVVVCQHYPDEFPARDVYRLLDLLPLSRCICCYAPWCEADGRTRDIWPAAVRVPVRLLPERLQRELEVLNGHRHPLPLTASRDEIYQYDHHNDTLGSGVPLSPSGAAASVSIISPDTALKLCWKRLLEWAGYRVVPTHQPQQRPAAVLWDVDPWRPRTDAALRAFHAKHPAVAVIALMNLPYRDDERALLAAGVSAIVPKLAPHRQLLETLARCRRLRILT